MAYYDDTKNYNHLRN